MPIDRRQILLASGAVAGAAALAACSGSGSASSSSAPASSGAAPSTSGAAPTSSSAAPAPSPSAGGTVLAKVSDVPVGGGVIVEVDGAPYAVTQPEAGSFRCFSAVCTHQGCTLNAVENGLLRCPCHGGAFTIDSGTVAGGPPKAPLADEDIEVDGDSIVLA